MPLRYVHLLMPQQLSPNELLPSELGKLQSTTLGSCKSFVSSIFRMAAEGSKEPIYLQSDDEDTGHTQSLMLFAGPVRRDECDSRNGRDSGRGGYRGRLSNEFGGGRGRRSPDFLSDEF